MKRVLAILFVSALAALLLYAAALLPPMGDADNPTNQHIAPRYLERGPEEAGTHNIVAGVLLNYRGYDTMAEVAVLSAALAGVFAVLGKGRTRIGSTFIDGARVEFSIVSRIAVILLVSFIMLLSIQVILQGTNLPGGGFQGGAAIGAGVMISTLALGFGRTQHRVPYSLRAILESTGILAFFVVGTIGVVSGANFLTYTLPGINEQAQAIARTTMLIVVEIGIGVMVGAVATSVFFALLREKEAHDVDRAA